MRDTGLARKVMENSSLMVLNEVVKRILACSFLPSHQIVIDPDSVTYYVVSGCLTMVEMESLVTIAEKFHLHYYVLNDFKGLAFRMYIPLSICDE